MAFPFTPLPALTELLIDGQWTEALVRERDGVTITRGRQNESGRVTPTRFTATFDNRDGRYSNRLPTSTYYGKIGRNTQLRHRLRWVYDTMDRNVANTWGSTNSGQTWTNAGTASDYYGDGTRMYHKHTSRNVYRSSTLVLPVATADVTATVSLPAVATGAPIYFHVLVGSDLSNYYAAQLTFQTSGNVDLGISAMVAGSLTAVGGSVTAGTYVADTQWSVRIQRLAGGHLRAKAWLESAAQPAVWNLAPTAPDLSLSGFTMAGVRSLLHASNTNTLDVFLAFWDFEVNSYRFWGEVPQWPQRWDKSGVDVTAPIEAAGIMRRLSQRGSRPLKSAIYRTMAGVGPGDMQPYAYWPAEEGSGATHIAPWQSGIPIMGVSGVTMAGDSSIVGSDPLPVFPSGSSAAATAPARTATGNWMFQGWMNIPSPLPGANTNYMEVRATGTGVRFVAGIEPSPLPAGLFWRIIDASGTQLSSGVFMLLDGVSGPMQADFFDHWWLWTIGAEDTGGGNVTYWLDCTNGQDNFAYTNVPLSGTPGVISAVKVYGRGQSAGHFACYDNLDFSFYTSIRDNAQALGGWAGETTISRLQRLCREEGVYLEIVGDGDSTQQVGPQQRDTLLNLLQAAADVDGGILYEPRDNLGLVYRTAGSLYNQTGVQLDYAASQIFEPFTPVEDDQLVVNDVTARRIDGSTARVVAEAGPLSIQDPPDGVGTYDEDRTFNAYTDAQLTSLAGWRAHLGTWDEARFPAVRVDLAAPAFSASASLTGQVAAIDVGDYLSVTNPPVWLPPDDIELLAQGYTERHRTFGWDITWNCVPAGPYKVFVLDSATLGRIDGSHELHAAVNTSATAWQVATTDGPVMTTSDSDDGFQWMVGGELVTVTDVAMSTPGYGAVGTAAHGNNASVTPGAPASIAAGNLLVIVAAIRNSGTGVPNTPSGWERMPAFEAASNVQMFCKVATGGDAMPLVSFTGGAANADTSAQCIRLTGKWANAANIAARSVHASCLNTSAQNIQLPGVPLTDIADNSILLYVGWKQDDWTSVATLGSYTEIAEASTTTGDDQAFVWGYLVQAARAFIAPATLTVTGGASAISRGAIVALECDYQDVTVTRSANGVAKSHDAGTSTALFPAPHLAL